MRRRSRVQCSDVLGGLGVLLGIALVAMVAVLLDREPLIPAIVQTPAWCATLQIMPTAAPACTLLYQSDFAAGTLILDVPNTCYRLAEDIKFRPNPHDDFMPTPAQTQYAGPMFRLGFFAAIVVQAPNVEIDLNNHEIAQSVEHRLQQRFFAVIELNSPFVPGQGPADFGPLPELSASGFTLRNGRVGRSSHHGLHGNGAWNVLSQDVDFVDYEVAAVALNDASHVVLRNTKALGSATDVPVLGTYSNARFLQPFVRRALHQTHLAPEEAAELRAASERLQLLMDQTFADVTQRGRIDAAVHPEAFALFDNAERVVDGNAYGFLLHARGVAVNDFVCEPEQTPRDVLLENCLVQNTRAHAAEVVALLHDGQPQLGPVGDVLRIAEVVDVYGYYSGHALSDTQIALAAFYHAANLPAPGTLRIHPAVVHWSRYGTSLATLVPAQGFAYARNADTMFHVNKGVMGLRVDGASRVALLNTRILATRNTGQPTRSVPLPGETGAPYFYNGTDGGHTLQRLIGYAGSDTRGAAFAASSQVWLENCLVEDVYSAWGQAHGLDLFNRPGDAGLLRTRIQTVVSAAAPGIPYGTRTPRAVGLRIAGPVHPVPADYTVDDVRSAHPGHAYVQLREHTQSCAA